MKSVDPAAAQLPLWSEHDPAEAWTVRESRRCRRLTVRVFHTGRVEVVVPPRTSRRALDHFIARHRPWIERKREEARRNGFAHEVFPPQQIELGACGEVYRVHIAGGAGRLRITTAGSLMTISGQAANASQLRLALRRWLMRHAAGFLGAELERCARELGFTYQRMIIRRQRTRWGSCSARGTISLNCCLMFQRPEVVRYLLIHELAHTRHMNHSRRFWQCVAQYCSDYEQLDRELLDGWRRVPSWVFGEH